MKIRWNSILYIKSICQYAYQNKQPSAFQPYPVFTWPVPHLYTLDISFPFCSLGLITMDNNWHFPVNTQTHKTSLLEMYFRWKPKSSLEKGLQKCMQSMYFYRTPLWNVPSKPFAHLNFYNPSFHWWDYYIRGKNLWVSDEHTVSGWPGNTWVTLDLKENAPNFLL